MPDVRLSTMPSRSLASARIELDALGGGTALRVSMPGDVAISSGLTRCLVDGVVVGGVWWPRERSQSSGGGALTRTDAIYVKARRPWGIETALTRLSYLRAQLLTMGTWVRLYGQIMAMASADDPPPPWDQAIAELLLADLPAPPAPLGDYVRALAEYQIGIDPISTAPALHLIDMSSTSAYRVPAQIAEWERRDIYTSAARAAISCRYQAASGVVEELVVGSERPILAVERAAGSRAEAYLEITLQRLGMIMAERAASMTMPLDVSWSPGDGVEYDGARWIVRSAEHEISADRASRTRLRLRPSPPLPSSPPADLRVLPQRDRVLPPN